MSAAIDVKHSPQRVIAEEQDDGTWLVLWTDNRVTCEPSKSAAERAINRDAKRRLGPDGMLVTVIEWRPVARAARA